MGFAHREDAQRLQRELAERLGRFKLELHADKTRLIEFGRYAAQNRQARGEGKPETFNFLGFTHICGKTRKGWYTVLRKTMRKRMQAKLKAIKLELRQRMHIPIPDVRGVVRKDHSYLDSEKRNGLTCRLKSGAAGPVGGSDPFLGSHGGPYL